MNLSIVILTFNERVNLPRLMESLERLPCSKYVVDSGSTDGTQQIAAERGASVTEHPFETHALQWAWALQNLPLSSDWVLALDADQYLLPETADEIQRLFSNPAKLDSLNGVYISRRQVFRGCWIRHGGYYPKLLLKIFRRANVSIDRNDLADHHFYVSGATAVLQHDMVEQNHKEDDISFWITKHDRYASLIAQEELARRNGASAPPLNPNPFGSPDQRTLWFKKVWRRLPLFIRPCAYFFYRYVVRFGWLDGKQGFIFHFLQGFWFRLLVDIKIDELRS